MSLVPRRRAWRLFPGPIALPLILAAATAAMADETLEQRLEAARQQLRDGHSDKAVASLRGIHASVPDHPGVTAQLSHALCQQARAQVTANQLPDALRSCEEAVSLTPVNPEPWLLLGINRCRLEQFEDGSDALERAMELHHHSPHVIHAWLGLAHYKLNRNDEALDSWRRGLKHLENLPAGKGSDIADQLRRFIEKAQREEGIEQGFDSGLSSHFRVRWDQAATDPKLGGLVRDLLEDAWNDVGYDLGIYPRGEIAVVIYGARQFSSAMDMHGWVAGLYDGKIRIPLGGPLPDSRELRRVVYHEFTHALLHSAARAKLPTWFQEGMAQHQEPRAPGESRAVVTKLMAEGHSLPTLRQLTTPFTRESRQTLVRLRYAVSHLLVERLLATTGAGSVSSYLEALRTGRPHDEAFESAFGQRAEAFVTGWRP